MFYNILLLKNVLQSNPAISYPRTAENRTYPNVYKDLMKDREWSCVVFVFQDDNTVRKRRQCEIVITNSSGTRTA